MLVLILLVNFRVSSEPNATLFYRLSRMAERGATCVPVMVALLRVFCFWVTKEKDNAGCKMKFKIVFNDFVLVRHEQVPDL